jgi:hypothetical protein
VRASIVAPFAIACRKPVSTAQPTPLCGSTISCALIGAKERTTSVVRSSELLSTTSSVKSRSVCAASASSVAVIRAASL